MAAELIEDMAYSRKQGYKRITHLLRHDFESLFYVAVWYIVTIPVIDGSTEGKTYRVFIRRWVDDTLNSIANNKTALFCYQDSFERIPIPPQCKHMGLWLKRFWGVFRMAFLVKTIYRDVPDKETLGGVVCRSAIKQALAGQSKSSDSVWSWEQFMSVHPYLTYGAPAGGEQTEYAGVLHEDDGSDYPDEAAQEPAAEVVVKQRRNSRKATTTKATIVKRTTIKKISSARKITKAKKTAPDKKPIPRVTTKAAMARTMTTRSMVKTKKS